ncbi:ABC transporter permease [Dactylosporangium sp. NBC_01737]|uniref:FtsX-like permease family protein n=1 Tax=Dactylosporangium sp. NBC_01737 TaxID=2975959 RepID=UPI002E140DCB|nr:ABC transporter permease [Dactylosporangium sp. NBC_01737]
MIRFGVRLTVAGGREAVLRLAVMAGAVGLGVWLLLSTLAGVNAVDGQFARFAVLSPQAGAADGPLWWAERNDYYDGRSIQRIDLATTAAGAPVPKGLPRLPGPGEYYVSPALADLIAATPADQLADRFPGRQAGLVGAAALPSPGTLTVIVGSTPDVVSQLYGARRVTAFPTEAPGIPVAALDLILSVVAGGLLFPVLIFIGTATRLTAARREQRFAAMRLIGGTPRQISVVAAVESTVAALLGTAAGFALYLAFRVQLAGIPFTGMPFHPEDVTLGPLMTAAVVVGVPLGAALAARVALRRVRISPLGVVRRVTPKPPRWYRLIPLLLGIAELTFFIGRVPEHSTAQVAVFLPGLLCIMVGLVIAGPWLTMLGARLLARRAQRPATLIAARRLADNPAAAFRAISGVVIGLFVTTVSIGIIQSITAERGAYVDALAASTMVTKFEQDPSDIPAPVLAALASPADVRSVTLIRDNPFTGAGHAGMVSCADLARSPQFGRCADGAAVAWVDGGFMQYRAPHGPGVVWPAAPATEAELAAQPVIEVVVSTDGATATLERTRTALQLAFPGVRIMPATEWDHANDQNSQLAGFQQLAAVIIFASLPIAGCSLAVSVIAGLTDRKRPFSLLRLTGVPLGVLHRVVALESAVSLLAAAVLAIGAGLLGAQLFLTAQMRYNLHPPGLTYSLIVVGGLVLSLAIIAATVPLLRRITGPETARSE